MIESPVIRLLVLFPLCWGVIAEKRAGGDDRSAPSVSSTSEPGGTPADPPPRLELDREIEQLSDRAAALEQVGKQDELLATQQELIERLRLRYPKSEYPDGHPALVRALERHTRSLFLGAKYDDLEPPAVAALAMIVSLNPTLDADTDRTAYSQIAGRLGKAYAVRKQTAKAKALNAEVVHRLRAVLPKDRFPEGHGDLADHLIIHARFLMADGKWDQAEEELVEARGYFRKAVTEMLRQEEPGVAKTIAANNFVAASIDLLMLLAKSQKLDRRLECARDSVEIGRRIYQRQDRPSGHSLMVLLLDQAGGAALDVGNSKEALQFRMASVLEARLLSEKDSTLSWNEAMCLSNLAIVELSVSMLDEAREHISAALEIAKSYNSSKLTVRQRIELASLLNTKALVNVECEELVASQFAFQQAIAIYHAVISEEIHSESLDLSKRLSVALGNYATVCLQMGEPARATELAVEQVALLRRVYNADRYPKGHRDLTIALRNLSDIHLANGRSENAKMALLECERMCKDLGVPTGSSADRLFWARVLRSLGEVSIETSSYENAERYFRESVTLTGADYHNDISGIDHIAICYNRISYTMLLLGRTGEAVHAAEAAVAVAREYVTDGYELRGLLTLARSLAYLARAYIAVERWDDAWSAHCESMACSQRYVESQAIGLSEVQCLNLIQRCLKSQMSLLNAWRHINRRPEELYNVLWKTRALTHRVLNDRRDVIEQIGGERARALLGRRKEIASQLAGLFASASSQRIGLRDNAVGTELTRERESIERELAELVVGCGASSLWKNCHLDALSALLPEDHVFVDIMVLPELDLSMGLIDCPGPRPIRYRYIGFINTSKRGVQFVDFGQVAQIDRVILKLRESLDDSQALHDSAEKLGRMVWDPIASCLQPGTRTVWICPEGLLTAVPWSVLPQSEGRGILLENFNISVVPAGHFIVQQLSESGGSDRVISDAFLMVGEVDFDQRDSSETGIAATTRGPLSDANPSWTSLPGTSDEIEGIQRIVAHAKPVVLRHRRATVGRVTEQLPRARWAHFATHGFFANPRYRSILQANQATTGQFEAMGPGDRHGPIARNPLLLSGLVLAGANKRQAGKVPGGESNDCGILTAEAISLLDLDNTDLVVLSACDTGLGDIAGREGVLGLQRAFHLAGVKNVVASLWKVDDEATALLMKEFYRNLAVEKQSPIAALRAAQLHIYRHPELLNSGSRNRGVNFKSQVPREDEPRTPSKSYTPARYWAAFTLSGLGL